MRNSNDYYELDIIQWVQALWNRIWAIILSAVIFAGAAFSYASFVITPTYEAEALLYVNNSSFSVGNTSFSISNSELSAAQSLVDTYIIILNSRTTLNQVIREADLPYKYSELKKMLNASAMNDTEVFCVKVTSEDPAEAERIANTITRVLPKTIAAVVDGSEVRIVDYAVIPSEKAAPNITLYTTIGLILGFVLMCIIVTVQVMMDTLIHNEDYLLETYQLPILAVIPDLVSNGKSGYYNSYAKTDNKEVKQQ